MSAEARVSLEGEELRRYVWWTGEGEITGVNPGYGAAVLHVGSDGHLTSRDPAAWRALAEQAVQVADELAALYAEHGAEPPAPALDETRSTA